MYEITLETTYTGEYGPLMFVEGKATTDNEWIAVWFKGNGHKVGKIEEPEESSKKKKSKGEAE